MTAHPNHCTTCGHYQGHHHLTSIGDLRCGILGCHCRNYEPPRSRHEDGCDRTAGATGPDH